MITKEDGYMVLRVPLKQKENNCYMDDKDLGETDNLIGIIAGNEYTISYLIDLSYKGDQQEGMPIVYCADRKELEDACKTLGIEIWEHSCCKYCGKVIRGCSTWGSKGEKCMDCADKKRVRK